MIIFISHPKNSVLCADDINAIKIEKDEPERLIKFQLGKLNR